ncbi:hypothetical protein MMC11_007961 [Xylographa trunciseda]|nr:hypothetical protein [Xylographa trunciseda]
MGPLQPVLWIATTCFIFYQIYSYIQKVNRYREHVRRNKCAEPPRDTNKLPGGLEHVWNFVMFDGTNILEELFIPRVRRLGLTYMQVVCGTRSIYTSDPRNNEAILGFGGAQSFDQGDTRRAAFRPMVKHGILSMDGPRWKRTRGLMRPFFTKGRIDDFEGVEKHVEILFQTMPTDSKGWTAKIDMLPRLFHFSMDSSSEYLYGRSVDSQLVDVPHADSDSIDIQSHQLRLADNKFVDAFDLVSKYTFIRVLLQDLYFLADGINYRRSCSVMHKWIDNFVRQALQSKQERKQKPEAREIPEDKKRLFIDKLADATEDPQELRDGALDLLLAGRNTTASTLCWIIFFLARHSQVYERLRREVITEFGLSTSPAEINLQRLKSVKYLQWILNESARVQPGVPLNTRQCIHDTVIPRGGGADGSQPIALMKGDQIVINWYGMFHSKEVWGPDADEFKPERWEKKESVGWEYTPFGRGPRVCIGQDFALAEIGYTVVRICQTFDKIEHTDEWDNQSTDLRLVMIPGKGVNVQLHRAET